MLKYPKARRRPNVFSRDSTFVRIVEVPRPDFAGNSWLMILWRDTDKQNRDVWHGSRDSTFTTRFENTRFRPSVRMKQQNGVISAGTRRKTCDMQRVQKRTETSSYLRDIWLMYNVSLMFVKMSRSGSCWCPRERNRRPALACSRTRHQRFGRRYDHAHG